MPDPNSANVDLSQDTLNNQTSSARNTVFHTEDGNNENNLTNFADAGSGSYSWGLYQYDVANNPLAAPALSQLGFTSQQINELKVNNLSSSTLQSLDTQLQNALSTQSGQQVNANLQNTWENLIQNDVQSEVDNASDAIKSQLLSDPTAIQRLYDISNQFSTNVQNGTLDNFLGGQTVSNSAGTVTWNSNQSAHDNLQNWFSSTAAGAAAGGTTRSNAFNTAVQQESLNPINVNITVHTDSNGNITQGGDTANFTNLTNVNASVGEGVTINAGGNNTNVSFDLGNGSQVDTESGTAQNVTVLCSTPNGPVSSFTASGSFAASCSATDTSSSLTVFGSSVNMAVSAGSVSTNGDFNSISIGSGSTGDNVSGNGNTVSASDGNTVTLDTNGGGGANNDNVFINGGTVIFDSSSTYSTVWGSGITVQDAAGVTGGVAGFEGNGNLATLVDGQVNAGSSNQSITVNGSNDSIYSGSWSGDQYTLGANQTDYIYGNDETIVGQSGDYIVDYGSNNSIYADGATVTDEGSDDMTYGDDDRVYGSGSGDGWSGTGDTGGGSGGSGGSGYSGSWGFDDASRQNRTNTVSSFDQSQGNAKAVSAASIAWSKASQAIAAATTPGMAQPSAINTARWGRTTISWSFADSATSGADAISGAVQTQYQAAVAQAFQTWAAASGITFKEVAAGAKSDITVGWGDLDPTDSGALGYTNTTTRGGLIQGATIRLEDPGEDALVADATGAYSYSGSTTTLEQLVLHEIGHTLGMAESSKINSIMFPELGSGNTTLSASDLQEIAILYPQVSPAAGADTTAMAQAMASFSAHQSAAGTSTMSAGIYAKTLEPAIAVPAC